MGEINTAILGGTILVCAILIPHFSNKETNAKPKKWGFVHVDNLPFSDRKHWSVIDNETKMPISFKNKERDQNINIQEYEHILISEHVVEWADDKQGIVGGFKTIRIYGKNYPESGFNIYSHTFSEKRNISIVYNK